MVSVLRPTTAAYRALHVFVPAEVMANVLLCCHVLLSSWAKQRKHNRFFPPDVFCPISLLVCLLSLPSVVFHVSSTLTSSLFHCVHRVAHFNSQLPLLSPPLLHQSSRLPPRPFLCLVSSPPLLSPLLVSPPLL